jgi:hypothetical protein
VTAIQIEPFAVQLISTEAAAEIYRGGDHCAAVSAAARAARNPDNRGKIIRFSIDGKLRDMQL